MTTEPIKIIKKKSINTKITILQQLKDLIYIIPFEIFNIFYRVIYIMKNTNRHEIEDTPKNKK